MDTWEKQEIALALVAIYITYHKAFPGNKCRPKLYQQNMKNHGLLQIPPEHKDREIKTRLKAPWSAMDVQKILAKTLDLSVHILDCHPQGPNP